MLELIPQDGMPISNHTAVILYHIVQIIEISSINARG